jgi:hypothetical protein
MQGGRRETDDIDLTALAMGNAATNGLCIALVFAAALSIAACGRFTAPAPAPASALSGLTGVPPCKGQRTTKKYAQTKVTLKRKGGSFCVPAFGGFGGAMQYPGVERSVHLVLRSSTQNIYNEPQLGSGTAIFYLNLHFLAGTHFGAKLKSEGGLTGEQIETGEPYTAFGIVAVGHLVLMFPPCYTVATQGPYGGVLANLGELFTQTTITGAGYGVVEIYSGEQVSQAC